MTGARGLVALTGASGFLGRRLVPALTERGWRVRALVRRPAAGLWGEVEPETVQGDLADDEALRRLAEGADAVVHAAGLIKAARRSDFFAVNEAGAARAARAAGNRRFLQISSLAAREPALSDYAASKAAGEASARALLGDRLIVLRPPVIYGPGDRETLSLFQLAAASPVMPVPALPAARLALAHADDVAAEVAEVLDGPWVEGTFALGGARPEGYGFREIFAAAAAAVGRSPLFAPVPGTVIAAAAAVSEAVGRLRGAPAIFNRGKAREILHPDWSVSAAELRHTRPPAARPLDQGFRDTVAWYRQAGWLR